MFSDILSVIGAVTGISGLIISILDHQRSRYFAVHEYLSAVESEEFVKAKQHVYNNVDFNVEDEQAAIVVNFFHHWGMLARRRYLPMWIFDGATGNGVCRLYEKTFPYINKRQQINQDPLYGEYFAWLYRRIKKGR